MSVCLTDCKSARLSANVRFVTEILLAAKMKVAASYLEKNLIGIKNKPKLSKDTLLRIPLLSKGKNFVLSFLRKNCTDQTTTICKYFLWMIVQYVCEKGNNRPSNFIHNDNVVFSVVVV